MASVLEQKPDPVAKYSSQVDEQIAQATSRIRVHDLMLGGLTLATLVAIYATAMILLDKNFNLSDGFRQLSLFGFGVVFGVVAYFMIGRPLRNRINPLYAAARVEETIEDAKNSVTGYVDAQERGNVHGAVRAAISAKAAKAVGEADVNHAVNHRNLLIVGGVLVVFLVTLAVLFFVFRPTQFSSLVGRAFLPFSPKTIATRTQITLLKPDPAEPTLSTGQTITVAVRIDGRIPAKTDPTRVRLLIRHNPADPTYEELPMQDDTSREWSLKVPEYLVQKGFWYKVAAGDAETPEYKVSVRSLPMFTDYDVSYEYPKYTRRPADKSTDPNLRAYRGTKITLLASANREVKDGFLRFTSGAPSVPGKLVAGKPNTLAFTFTATEATTYRLAMTTTSGDRSADVPPFTISLDQDTPPRVEVLKPEEAETPIPANGQLAVDGTVGDDFGIDKVRLCLRVDNRDLKPVMYEGGKSFRRDKDGTWPNDLVYKGSVEFTKLTFTDGQKFEPKENMIVEFWLEAIDNCTETKPVAGWGDKPQTGQVGRSETRRVRLTPPKTDPEEKKQQDDQKQQRKNEEKNHNAQQQQKFDNEKRDPQQQDQGQQPKEGEPKGKDGDPKKEPPKGKDGDTGMGNMGDPMKQDNPPKKDNTPEGKKDPSGMGNNGKTDPKMPPEGKQDPKMPPEGKQDPSGMGNNGKTDPKMPPEGKTDPKTDPKGGMNSGMGNMGDPNAQKQPPEPAPMPKSEEEKKAEQDAQKVQDELNKNKGEGGDAKPNPNAEQKPEERQDPGKAKPQPMGNGGQNGESKPEPKSGDPMNPMGPKGENGASESKPQGNLEKPPEKSEPKPQPKSDTKPDPKNPSNTQDGAKGNPSEQRDEPLGGGRPGEEKPQPKKGDAPQKEPGKDPMSGSSGKPSTETKPGDPKGGPDDKQNPAENAAETKPNGDPNRGQDKKPGQPKPGQKPDPKQKSDPNAGTAKPEKAPPTAETKPPAPKEGTGGKQPDASETKPEPKDAKDPMNKGGGASETKPEPQKPMGGPGGMNEEKAGQPGEDKPNPKDAPKTGGNNANAKDKEPKGDKKLSDKERKELEDAANNLDNPDPAKRKDAQDKLDKAIGKEKRQELEQLGKDLKSDDPAKREAAQKKLDQMKKEAEAQAKKDGKKDGEGGKDGKKDGTETKDKGKELSPEEIGELAKKAGDLNSTDQQKREAAEKEFDKKLGKEAREKLQEELKKNPPMNPMDPKGQDDLKKQIEEQAKKNPKPGKGDKTDEFTPGGNSSTEPPNPEDPTDPKNKLKTAQLQLEEFEKNRYNKDLQDKLGWSQKDYDDFLKAQRERVKQMEAEQAKLDDEARNRPAPAGEPTIKVETGGKVESRPSDIGKGGTTGGAVYSPPGFEDARKKFAEELRKLQPKK